MENQEMGDEPVAFDMGVSTLTRINYWLWKCNEFSFADDVHNWYKALKIIYKEGHPFMKSKAEDYKEPEGMNKAYEKYIEWESSMIVLSRQNRNHLGTNPDKKIFDLLGEWELKLRNFLDKAGLLMRKGEDAKSAMLR